MKHTVSDTQKDILLLLGWALLLLACSFWHPSLLAHDEGTYAAESRFMLNQGNWLAREWWDMPTYSHGIFLNWLIMVGYLLFGQHDVVARVPSVLACLASVVLTYDIAKFLIASQPWPSDHASAFGGALGHQARSLGLLSGLVLMLFSVWAQFGHLVSQNTLLVCVELLGVWALLKSEKLAFDSKTRLIWGFVAGVTFGLGFLIKTFMILLPAVALLPYLIFQHRRHRHLANPGLWLGLMTGVGAVLLWLWLGMAEYGDLVLDSMFGKLNDLGSESFNPDGSPYYYLWNIPVNTMPWGLFSLVGAGFVMRSRQFWQSLRWQRSWSLRREDAQPIGQHKTQHWPHAWLLLYPFVLTGLLTLFPTKTPYYPLQIHPFMAIFCAIALHHIAYQTLRWPRRLLSYSFAALGLMLVMLSLFTLTAPIWLTQPSALLSEIRPYIPLAFSLGLGWACLPVFMAQPQKWLATWLIPAWLTLSVAGLTGLYGDYSPDLKAALTTAPIQPILSEHTVGFILVNGTDPVIHKTFTLLSFYTPTVGRLNPPVEDIATGTYFWLSPASDQTYLAGRPHETLATLRAWQLVKMNDQ